LDDFKQGAEQNAKTDAIQTTVNGNTNQLVKTITNQHEEFRNFVSEQQRIMAQVVSDNAKHMRELADKLAEMLPPAAVPQVIAIPAAPEDAAVNPDSALTSRR
jgi:uncharacterized protein (DUF885 family)